MTRERPEKFVFHPFLSAGSSPDEHAITQFIAHFGGIRFHSDSALKAVVRVLGMVARKPRLMVWTLPRYVLRRLQRVPPGNPLGFAWQLMTGRARRFTVVSHHFMSHDEIDTSTGQERLKQCVFRVPYDGRLMSMCEFNAKGYRDQLYQMIQSR